MYGWLGKLRKDRIWTCHLVSSLSHFMVFLYFLVLITEEGFLISPCFSLGLYIQTSIFLLFSFSISSFISYFNNLKYADDTTLMAESEEELKNFLMNMKEENEKADLKLSIQKTKIITSGPITSWQIDGVTMEVVTDFIFLGSKIIADSDCRHEIKRQLLLERKTITSLDSVLKSRDITLPKKLCLVKSYGLSNCHLWM